ncbi:DUF421 domain-containing protein [Paraliobacillus sediminis]|uniref:DUF421 domain-containing protein n=1 Tax=Paraliobacillus sediminis TaxID=1885916 RepID=UPI000E3C4164|nr:DUF421 domain-containing protein [Paraliobacillus sediminis]
MQDIGSIFIETLFGFLCLFIITKVLGKSQIRQLTAFDFISALVLGELVGNALFDDEVGVTQIGFAVLLWGFLLYITEWMTQKFKRTRSLLEGRPSIIIHSGKLQREVMAKAKLDVNQLLHLLRSKDVFSIRDVAYAILETDGTVSVLKTSHAQTPTRLDLNLNPEDVRLSMALINDGEIIKDNLKEINQDQAWLENELKIQNVDSYKDVFYAEYKRGEVLFVQTM